MKLYRFTARGFAMGRIIEAGETVLMGDDTVPSAHMVDVATESEAALRGEELPEPVVTVSPSAVFRADLAYVPAGAAEPAPVTEPVPMDDPVDPPAERPIEAAPTEG